MVRRSAFFAGLALLIACSSASTDEVSSTTNALGTGACPDVPNAQCLEGLQATAPVADANRCVPDVLGQFSRLKERGEVMGFWDGGASVGYPSLACEGWPWDECSEHWQGFQRLPYPRSNYAVLTSSSDAGGHYAVVNMSSRTAGAFTGRRWGANRMSTTNVDWNNSPDKGDAIIQSGTITGAATYTHASGIQMLGQFLAIPSEGIGNPTNIAGQTELFDTSGPLDPHVQHCDPLTVGCFQSRWTFFHSNYGNGAVALAKLKDGRYVMVNALTSAAKQIEVNVSRLGKGGFPFFIASASVFGGPNLHKAGFYSARYDMVGLAGWADYQALQLVTECGSGHLYLIGTQDIDNEDWAHLWRLNLVDTGTVNGDGEPILSPSREATFVKVASKHFYCTARTSGRQCDFASAAGTYVDPSGALVVYATVHDDSAPSSGVTRMVEFSANDPLDRPDTAPIEGCDTQDKMWVELSDGVLSGGRPVEGSQRFFIEWQRQNRSQASFSTAYAFNDLARSIRYCLPPGFRYKLCSDAAFGGTCQFFCGTSGAGCSGTASGGAVQSVNLGAATSSSGCFTSSTSSACL